jgi:hypothetical protein
MVLRPMDSDIKLFTEPHVQTLAESWGPRKPRDSAGRKQSQRAHLTPQRHHHFHFPLHVAHR